MAAAAPHESTASDEALGPEAPALRAQKWGVWAATWLSYAAYYFGRKGLSVAKKTIATELGKDALRGVDTVYLAAYALGQYVHGFWGDRVGAKRLIAAGMLASAAACFVFGATSLSIVFLIAFGVNGFAQATGWPGNIKAMAEWTTPERRGRVMGLWATCYQVGGIAATAFATMLLGRFGWRSAFWGPALVLILVALLVVIAVRPGPKTAGAGTTVRVADGEGEGSVEAGSGAREDAAPGADATEAVLQREARAGVLKNPTIYCFGASYFFLKLIRYSLLFWLPFYLETSLQYDKVTAGYLSTSFEIGGVLGTIVVGWLSDRFRLLSRPEWAAISVVLLTFALLVYAKVGGLGVIPNFTAMALVGFLLFGPDALLSGAAAQDLGGPRAAAVAAGLINGIGSLGAILQEAVTVGVSEKFGWNALFMSFVLFSALSVVALAPVLIAGRRAKAPATR